MIHRPLLELVLGTSTERFEGTTPPWESTNVFCRIWCVSLDRIPFGRVNPSVGSDRDQLRGEDVDNPYRCNRPYLATCSGMIGSGNEATNLIAGGMSAEIALQASAVTQKMKCGYLLGAARRSMAMAHFVVGFAGAVAAVTVFHGVMLWHGLESLGSEAVPFPDLISGAAWTAWALKSLKLWLLASH